MPFKHLSKSGLLLILTAVVWLIFDIYIYLSGEITISEQILNWSKLTLSIPMGLGLLMGHWFLKKEIGSFTKQGIIFILLIFSLLGIDLYLLVNHGDNISMKILNFYDFNLGIPVILSALFGYKYW